MPKNNKSASAAPDGSASANVSRQDERQDDQQGDQQGRRHRGQQGERRGTATASFGTGARESHDSSAFYARFVPPQISDDETVVAPADRPFDDTVFHGTAQHVLSDQLSVRDNSVALVVTSPPYFVGKTYEEAMGQGHVPAEYDEHLATLHEIFSLCVNKLEPGGRIAVNVANLGRKPYRSQAADVIRIFEDLGLLIRGEIIWKKGDGMNSSTAWGSFQKPSNPVLRDLTERVIVASKGRFDRALSSRVRAERGLPNEGSIYKEEFMAATKDVWEIPSESATRVGHPAPFPLDLPRRLIDLYTYYGDLILDPYMGSGTTAVAALSKGRNFVGCETEQEYIDRCAERVNDERERIRAIEPAIARSVQVPSVRGGHDHDDADVPHVRALREGQKADHVARLILEECGFTDVSTQKKKLRSGVEVDVVAFDQNGDEWHFDLTGTFGIERDGLRRSDTLWKALGRAAARHADSAAGEVRGVMLTTALPESGPALAALRACAVSNSTMVFDAVEVFSAEGQERLVTYAAMGYRAEPPTGIASPSSHAGW